MFDASEGGRSERTNGRLFFRQRGSLPITPDAGTEARRWGSPPAQGL
jgi:hypothetical protein